MAKLLIVNPRSMNSQMSYIHHLNYFADQSNDELFLICESVGNNLINKKINIIELARKNNRLFFAIKFYLKAAKLIVDNNIDKVISSYGHFNSLLVLFLLKAKISKQWQGVLIYDLRSASVSGIFDSVQNKAFFIESLFYQQIIAVSEYAAVKTFGKSRAAKCFISGVGSFSREDVEKLSNVKETTKKIREKFQIQANTLVILYVGTLSNRCLDKFIELFDFNEEEYCFFIIGDGDDNSETNLHNVISSKKLSSQIHFLGRLPYFKLPAFLSLAHVGIAYAPDNESLYSQPFTKIQEYAEFKMIVLASDNLENNQSVDSAEVVYLSEYNSISKLKELNKAYKNKLCRKKTRVNSWYKISERLYSYLKSI